MAVKIIKLIVIFALASSKWKATRTKTLALKRDYPAGMNANFLETLILGRQIELIRYAKA